MASPARKKMATPKVTKEQVEGVQKIQELENKAFVAGVEIGRGELFTRLAKIEARLEFLNERDNLNSFALAGSPPEDFSAGYSGMPMNPPVTTSGSAPPTVLSRLAELEERIEEFEVKHGALYSRVGALEDGVGIDVVTGPSQARRR